MCKKDFLFIIGDWNAKVGSQEIPGVTVEFGLGVDNEAEQRLIGLCQENALVIPNTPFQQHQRRLYTWTSPDGQYWNQVDYILCNQRWRYSIQSAKARHMTVTQIMNSLLPSVQFSCSVVSDSLGPHELQHARPPCPSPTPKVHSNSRPSSWWCHPAISSSLSPSPPAPNPSQHQSLFQWVNSLHEVAKVLEFQL